MLADSIQTALDLKSSLQDASLQPNHVCSTCRDILLPFLRLKTNAILHEKFLLEHQAKIRELGLKAVRIELEEEEEEGANDAEEGSSNSVWDDNGEAENDALSVEDEDIVHCKICGPSKFFKKSSLPSHLRNFHKEKDIGCEVPDCKAKFKKKADMMKHVRNVHNNEKSLCVQCGDSFKDLYYHMKVFHENIRHRCDQCEKQFTTKQGLMFHIKNSHGDRKKEVCHICAVEVKHVRHHIKLKHSGEE